MFAQAPLDVFTLYHHVKGKGGMNEVTKKKEWGEIVRLMNFPVSPSAGFTLKKQYVKFLFEVRIFRLILFSFKKSSRRNHKLCFSLSASWSGGQLTTKKSVKLWTNHCVRASHDRRVLVKKR